MKAKKIVALLLVGIMLLSFGACGGNDIPENEANELTEGALPDNLIAEKVGSIDRDDFYTCDGGLYYQDEATGKIGVMSFEGNHDTGAVYAYCAPISFYFKVSKSSVNNRKVTEPATLNDTGLIDGKGNVLVPEKYAYISVISERYFLAVQATGVAGNKENALVAYTNGNVDSPKSGMLSDEENDLMYSGKWCVYDKTTGKVVPGISGTKDQTVVSYGDYIVYNDDNGERHVVDAAGKPLEHTRLFDDGSYAVEGKIGTVYGTDGKKLFDYDLTSYVPKFLRGDYYEATLSTQEGTKYVVMDKTGKVVSSEFDTSFTFYDDIMMLDGKLYDATGKSFIQGTYESVIYDKLFGESWILRNNETYTMINRKGEVLFEDTESDGVTVWTSDFVASKDGENGSLFYSHKDKDYTIEGYTFAPWLVKTTANNNLYNVVSTISGETIFEGYSSYSYTTVKDTALYVYAKYNGGADVYLIVNDAQLEDLMTKKNKLLDDLTATFEKEGITVSVNKETGELSMDSSVLFGGDSAELTAEGKAFLDKFVKAYTSIAYSDEYDGFIAKTIVEGHTAPTADTTYAGDMQLSEDRANNVKSYCVSTQSGAALKDFAEDLEAVGYSNSQPVYGADGNVDMDASRRVSFRFMLNIDLLN